MKKRLVMLVAVCFLMLSFRGIGVAGQRPTNQEKIFFYKFVVVYDGAPLPLASVMCISKSGEEIYLECNNDGEAEVEVASPITLVCGLYIGLSGVVKVHNSGELEIVVKKVNSPSFLATASRTGTFAVYSTNKDGDVTFKYLGKIKSYFCTSKLPSLGSGNYAPDPNKWDKKDVSGFKSPYKGKLLYVPRRYQQFHSVVYGFSISQALFLKAEY